MDAIGRLRAALTDAGYDAAGLAGALQREPGRSSMPHELPLAARRAELAPAPLRTAIRPFVLGQAVAADEVARLLPPVRADDLVALGLAADDGAFLRPRVRLAAHERFLLASDPTAGMHGSDYVPGVTRPSWLLSHLTVRRPVARALEIGTGNGMLALIASTHAEHVVATDVNEHALELAELNLPLNDVRNVELRAGSFFEPVEGERFDLVFSNPPYVISPETSY